MKSAAQPAAVRPRVVPLRAPEATPVLLEDLVERWLADGNAGVVAVHGQPGSGKSTALAHMAWRFAPSDRLRLLDEPGAVGLAAIDPNALVVCTTTPELSVETLARLRLAPWRRDEWIEYLLARDETACASVMERLRADDDADRLCELAELCAAVLDGLARDESVASAEIAIARQVARLQSRGRGSVVRRAERLLGRKGPRRRVASSCLRMYLDPSADDARRALGELEKQSGDAWRLLRHGVVRAHFAARGLVRCLERGRARPDWLARLAPEIARYAAPLVGRSRRAKRRLGAWLEGGASDSASVASLWHAADPDGLAGWLRARGSPPASSLEGARLRRAAWSSLDLRRADLGRADLSGATLRGARLNEANLRMALLTRADLEGADLEGARASGADLARARLSACRGGRVHLARANLAHADLEDAQLGGSVLEDAVLTAALFRGANLSGASLLGAVFAETDFRGARLDFANLLGADLRSSELARTSLQLANLANAQLEGLRLDGVNLSSANLHRAHLTGASLRGATATGAILTDSHLADVDAEGVDLTDADLSRASFHMGSSRSGLVFHAMPMEGSRTGFYTDDYLDHPYRRPEEVRKANLCGADLRGALVFSTDFYLVDMRDVRCTRDQYEHFRRCGAILSP